MESWRAQGLRHRYFRKLGEEIPTPSKVRCSEHTAHHARMLADDLANRKNADGMFTTINLPSGTHHLKFVVDGEMVTSPSLPTAVDFNNFLVNYIEIATEDLSKPRRESAQPGPRT